MKDAIHERSRLLQAVVWNVSVQGVGFHNHPAHAHEPT